MHLSEVARKLRISKPVVSRHLKILKKAGLVRVKTLGNLYLFSTNVTELEERAMDVFMERHTVKISKDATLFDALKQLPDVEIKSLGGNRYITSIDGEKGYYIYEVNGISPAVPIDEYKPEKTLYST
ncbi:MAG TPA: ArsR family transcriptional regulator [Thermoplasmata archaeon]|nr:ArsR family transcriptional regulator [Thermoplasmata archaeon]